MKNRHQLPSRICALLLALAILCSFAVPVATAADISVTFTQIDNDAVTAQLPMREAEETENVPAYADTDSVRVSIFLEGVPTISQFGAESIAANQAAVDYRAGLETRQESVSKAISLQALDGKELDVVWNLTLAANIISANVEYGQIEAIEQVPGVEKVLIENRYEPAVLDEELPADPNMATSSAMIGSSAAWAAGYTGAGTRIAVIDTGTDTDHQSFDAEGFDYSLKMQAEKAGKTVEDYDLLDASEIADVLPQLHVSNGVTAEQLYRSTKLPFGYNYIDKDLDITHDNDRMSEHGSHVAGIAAANAYIPNGDGTFSFALDSVKVQGVAPDAQLITMKVFGKNGGAYESDYLAAIEDAIVLKCDAVNLSLGSPNPGMTRNAKAEYQAILDNLTKCGVVVAIAAGNEDTWVDQAQNGGYLYSDDVSMDMVGSPGSYTNSLCVASIDNAGATGAYFTVGDTAVVYAEGSGYMNKPLTSITGEHEYILIDGIGTKEEFKAIAAELKGKIAVCARGTISFTAKANAAVSNGAIATIVYNNEPGIFGMDISDYFRTAPCVSVTQADGAMMKAVAEAVTAEDGTVLCYKGSLTVKEGMGVSIYEQEFNTMSSFSSWGVPGSLELKPEITAPGGNIYSVNGQTPGGTSYEVMSGTSMATPQVAGMSALVAQYIRENGLAEKTGLTPRILAQSLLMSTAIPQLEDFGDGESGYYPVLRQGAGLANVSDAIAADSYILMGEDATRSYADGKVKAELGADPERTGVYEFSFSIHNLTAEEKTYALSADFFTQDLFSYDFDQDGVWDDYMATWTVPLEADVTFDAGQTVTVAGNGSASVKVTVRLTAAQKAELDKNYPCGAYVQGFVYAASGKTEEGVEGTSHSIPVLGFYGNWSDASMFEEGSRAAYETGDEARLPYLGSTSANSAVIVYANDRNSKYYFGGNPLVVDDHYMPERNAINSENGDQISQIFAGVIRNAGASRILARNLTAAGQTMLEEVSGAVYSAYFSSSAGAWQYTNYNFSANFTPKGAAEGDQLELSLTLAPEYNVDPEGNVDWDALGKGASFTVPMVVDNTAPELLNVFTGLMDSSLMVKARDNQYVAGVVLYNITGSRVLAVTGAKQDIQPGEEGLYAFDLNGIKGSNFLLRVYDYALNATTYEVSLQSGGQQTVPDMMAFRTEDKVWIGFGQADRYKERNDLTASDRSYTAATEVDGMVFGATDKGDLYVLNLQDMSVETLVANMGVTLSDMAYDRSTATLYGVTGNHLVSVDKLTAAVTDMGEIPFRTNTLACDGSGTFYSAVHGESSETTDRGFVYAYTLETLREVGDLNYDFDGDGNVDTDDGQAILDCALGVRDELENAANADFDGNGRLTSRDAYLFLEKLGSGAFRNTPQQISFKTHSNVKALEWNPNDELLYGVLYTMMRGNSQAYNKHAYFYAIDPVTGTDISYRDFQTEITALVIPQKDAGNSWANPTDEISGVQISAASITVLKGFSKTLTASVQPWTATDRSVTWSSANPEIATVDETGAVTGVAPGETVITAASVLDPTVSATCSVTVETLDITLNGALQDKDGNSTLFTWNMESDETWKPGMQLNIPFACGSYDAVTNRLYLQDSVEGAWFMHQVDLASGMETGKSSAACGFGFAMSDIAALELFNTEEKPGIVGVALSYLLSPCDPMGNSFSRGWNLTDYLAQNTGGTSLVAVASMGTATNDDGVLCDMLYALDDAGYLWSFLYDGTESLGYDVIPTDLELDFPTYNEYQFCSMVQGNDGNLYLSHYTGETNDFYRLVWSEEQGIFTSDLIGSAGYGVWPATLYAVETNAPAQTNAMRPVGILDKAAKVQAQALDVQALTAPMSEAHPTEDGKTFAVTVTAKDADGADTASGNGMAAVSYDVSALELTDVTISGDYTAMVTADGTVTFGYVSMEGIAAGDPVARLTFTVKDGATPSVTVTHKEINDAALNLTEELILGCAHIHTEIRDEKNATDTEDGYTGDIYCVDCGLLLVKGEAIPAHCASKSFTDVNTDKWYHEYIDHVVDEGLMQGMGNNQFVPEGTMTRGMLVTTLYRLAGQPEVGEKSTFIDVPEGCWYAKAVAWAQANGIVKGVTETNFCPDALVTREQAAAFLYRYAIEYLKLQPVKGADLSVYKDAGKISNYAKESVAWATAQGLFEGFPDGTMQPAGTLTRAQMAKLLTVFERSF